MALNKHDIAYRDSSGARIQTRLFVAVVVGVFANWKWLLILIGVFALGEFVTMYKVLSHPMVMTQEQFDAAYSAKEKAELKGHALGSALVAAFFAMLSVLFVASLVKLARDFILSLFSTP
ncbi:MAG: hypothetical protein EXS31_08455 [Pedosphaera sp.]|nr:hypothetical protein [Pedosphaera sp.]